MENGVGTIGIVTKSWEVKGGIRSASATLYNLDLLQSAVYYVCPQETWPSAVPLEESA